MLTQGPIILALAVLGPVAIGLLLERSWPGRGLSLAGACVALVGAVILLKSAPVLGPPVGLLQDWIVLKVGSVRPWNAQPDMSAVPGPNTTSSNAELVELQLLRERIAKLALAEKSLAAELARLRSEIDAERAAHEHTRRQLNDARMQAKAAPEVAPRASAEGDVGAADAAAVLESERKAHAKTRIALKAVEEQVAALESSRARLAEELSGGEAEQSGARAAADEAQSRLVLAEATIARLEAALRAAAPRTNPPALPDAPAPFASRPTAAPAASKSAPPPDVTGSVIGPDSELARRLSRGVTTRHFALSRIATDQLVQGRSGSYFRIVCRDGRSGRRLTFEGGGYVLSGSAPLVEACLTSIEQDVLAALPATTARKLYVEGFASPSGFIKPQRLGPADTHLRSIDYLPRSKQAGEKRYSPSPIRQSVGATFTNKELPLLRGAHVANVITKASSGSTRPDVLEGETRVASDEASRSFDLVLFVAW